MMDLGTGRPIPERELFYFVNIAYKCRDVRKTDKRKKIYVELIGFRGHGTVGNALFRIRVMLDRSKRVERWRESGRGVRFVHFPQGFTPGHLNRACSR